MSNLIKDIADCERPYEKASAKGVSCLTDAELLAVILRSGTSRKSSIDLANEILNAHISNKGITGISYLSRNELLAIKGIGNIKATQILAIGELSKRLSTASKKVGIQFTSPESIAEYYIEKLRFCEKESTYLMMFSGAHTLIKDVRISEGTINQALISPREIFIEALKYNAVYIIIVHNHPSGLPEPSEADIKATIKIQNAGKIMDVRLSDHIIVGHDRYVSMLERGIIS